MSTDFALDRSPEIAAMIVDAREAFLTDPEYLIKIARSGAVLARRRQESTSERSQEALTGAFIPEAYVCPPEHSHGVNSDCLVKHGCACDECSSAERNRVRDIRQRDRAEYEARPVTVTWGPAKSADKPVTEPRPERLNNHPHGAESPRNIVDPNATGKGGVNIHGRSAGYERRGCRCGKCRRWKAEENSKAKARRANKDLHTSA